mmetsp:Transcript_10835/g.17521  ORF Transcript_10835/g.17521 Transcript_10835/m.17521 type:complete len:263 (+) Transcript_10835:1484-2272(+)
MNCHSSDRSSLAFQARCAQQHLASTHGKISTRNTSHHENGREILRSDLESMQGQEAAEDAKQPAAENKDATLPPPPGSAPRKKPTEPVTDAVQELHEAEDDETVEQGKKVVMALGGLRPRPTTCTKVKTGTMCRHQSEEAWTSVEQEMIELDSPEEWAELFRSDGNRGASRGAVPGTAKQQQVHRNVQFPIKKPETTQCEVHKKTQFLPMKMKFAPSRGGFTKISRRGLKQAMTCKLQRTALINIGISSQNQLINTSAACKS